LSPPSELEHRPWWAIRTLNYDPTATGEQMRLQLSELEDILAEAYKSSRLFKERAKFVRDRMTIKDFSPSMKMLLHDSRLHLFLRKLGSR